VQKEGKKDFRKTSHKRAQAVHAVPVTPVPLLPIAGRDVPR
jgi:hypothetical protein